MHKIINFFFFLLLLISVADAADLNIDPTTLKLKVRQLWVSTSPLCTNLVKVIDETDADYTDILTGPSLGSGQVSDGTYPCVVFVMSDLIKFVPNANSDSSNCSTATEETLDVCSSGTSSLPDGTTTTCSNGEDLVAMYMSTTSDSGNASGADAFNPPLEIGDTNYGFPLGSALVISGTSGGTFVVDGTDKVCDGDDAGCEGGFNPGQCQMLPPSFTFQSN